jgi:hypothetical protein
MSIITATSDNKDSLIVTFSDVKMTGYVAEELLELRPYRQSICLSTINRSAVNPLH